MRRTRETFDRQKELGARLKELREQAGLTQAQLSLRMGRKGKQSRTLLSRLETGRVQNISLNVVLDYLRACRADPADIVGALRTYTSRPTAVEEKGALAVAEVVAALPRRVQREVAKQDVREAVSRRFSGKEPESAEVRALRARKRAAAAKRRDDMLWFVSRQLTHDNIGFEPSWMQRRHLMSHSAKVWSICLRTRKSKPGRREELLARAPDWLKGVVPDVAMEFVQFLVRRVFETMQQAGDLDRIPTPGQPGTQIETREEFQRRLFEFQTARRKAMDSIIAEAHDLLREAGVPEGKLGLYDHTVRFFCHIADTYPEDDPRRAAQIEAHVSEPRFARRGRKPDLCCEVGAFTLARYAELKKTLPPDPNARR